MSDDSYCHWATQRFACSTAPPPGSNLHLQQQSSLSVAAHKIFMLKCDAYHFGKGETWLSGGLKVHLTVKVMLKCWNEATSVYCDCIKSLWSFWISFKPLFFFCIGCLSSPISLCLLSIFVWMPASVFGCGLLFCVYFNNIASLRGCFAMILLD